MKKFGRLLRLLIVVLLAVSSAKYTCSNTSAGGLDICKYTDTKYYRNVLDTRFPHAMQNYDAVLAPKLKSAALNVHSTVKTKIVPCTIRSYQSLISYLQTKVYPKILTYTTITESYVRRGYLHLKLFTDVTVIPSVRKVYYKLIIKYPIIEHYIYSGQAYAKLVQISVAKYINIFRYHFHAYDDKYGYGKLSRTEKFITFKTWFTKELYTFSKYLQHMSIKFWNDTLLPTAFYLKELFISQWNSFIESGYDLNKRDTDDSVIYENDEEDYTETSTIFVTLTATDDVLGAQSKATQALDFPREDELDLPLQEVVKNQLAPWTDTVESKLTGLIKDFESDINEYADAKLSEVEPILGELLKKASNTSQKNFQIITRAIMDINCTESVDPVTNETIWFDQDGTQLSRYMTRELMREFFSAAHSEFDAISKEIREHLKKLANEVNGQVEVLRQENVEVYEEWADVMITEFSKQLAYIDVAVNNENEDSLKKEHRENWRAFMKLKRQVIDMRDRLLEHPVELDTLQKFVNKAQFTLKTLSHENGEYLYILRSKANLEFQAREALERKARLSAAESSDMVDSNNSINTTVTTSSSSSSSSSSSTTTTTTDAISPIIELSTEESSEIEESSIESSIESTPSETEIKSALKEKNETAIE